MTYEELLKQHKEEANSFTDDKLFFAFGTTENEVKSKLEEQGVKVDDIVGIGAGGYIKKEYYNDLLIMMDRQAKELKEYTLNNLNEVLTHEFANYELEINFDYSYRTFLIDVLGFTEKEIEDNKDEINKAINDYRTEFYKHN